MKNRMAFFSLMVILPAAVAACGGNVAVDGAAHGGSASTGSSSTSGTGASTGSSSTSGTGASTGSSSGTTTGNPGCAVQSQVFVAPSTGGGSMLGSICASPPPWNPTMSSAALGYLLQGGAPPGLSELHVIGCLTPSPGSEGVQIVASGVTGPGMYDGAETEFVDAMGTGWSSKAQINVTKLGPVGDTIEGNYFGTFVTLGQPAIVVKGDFQVCHVPDQDVP